MKSRWLPPLIVATLIALAVPTTAQASGPARGGHASSNWHFRPTAAVSLGDSYISGEGARWKGNSADPAPGHAGTDRALTADGTTDPSLVYGATTANGCHRSDVAPILSAKLLVAKRINLACSGARTYHVLRAQAGGESFKGEAPQDDQLAQVAKTNDVKLIVLSIGGNDLGFSSILTSCVVAYLFQTPPCSTTQQATVDAALPKVRTAVAATVDDINATMADAGYRPHDYRLIVESYPAPTPAVGSARYTGSTPDARGTVGGCPLYDADAAWSHDTLVPALTGVLAEVAKQKGAQFLDLRDAFHGHELCASTDEQSDGSPRSSDAEWVRFIDLAGQGDVNESLHPNYYGQQALGACLTEAALVRRDAACHAVAGFPSRAVYLTR